MMLLHFTPPPINCQYLPSPCVVLVPHLTQAGRAAHAGNPRAASFVLQEVRA